ncbi:alpha/beta fold hydrolase [Trinickia mobilis]|uniref:alpha/beta fold hydrolase n=1 Tax=Trinickia mobilis TaxID=2816356 RepID=UPI001A8E663D|nr:alpha/beta hydrolase [Trinickia mobilis]
MKSLVTDSGIACQVTGEGPAMLLISGLGGNASFWSAAVERLATEFQVITFDYPGVGESAPVQSHSIPAIARAATDVMDLCHVKKAVVAGHATGSLVAQTLALDNRQRCDGLVLSAGWAKADRRFRDLMLLRRHMLQTLGSRAYSLLSGLLAYPNDTYNETIASDAAPDLSDPHTHDEATISRIDMLLAYSRADELSELSIRTLVVGAIDDAVVPFEHSKDLASLVAGAQLVNVTGGHFFPITNAQQYVETVRNFMGHV